MFTRVAFSLFRVREYPPRYTYRQAFLYVRAYSTTSASDPHALERTRNTAPSSSKPANTKTGNGRQDVGFLAFTKSSLYKLTLPLNAPSNDASSVTPDDDTNSVDPPLLVKPSSKDSSWEEEVERGREAFDSNGNRAGKGSENDSKPSQVQSVIFLLHSGQPLSYIANLIHAESPEFSPAREDHKPSKSFGDHTITFHTGSVPSRKRWSPATGIGDFLREAARVGNFTISIGSRNVHVNVPSFEERTRFLRANLHEKTRRIEALTLLKDECDEIARKRTHKIAFAGAGVMASWWLTVGFLTFRTDLGWDFMEPVTYLTGFGMVIGSYLYFLWRNREVSYRSVLTDTTSRRQHKLYGERGLDLERYSELIEDAKGYRKAIKTIAEDYGLEWDQGDTEAGRSAKRALQVVRRDEEDDRKHKTHEERGDAAEDDALAQVDDDADGKPDRK